MLELVNSKLPVVTIDHVFNNRAAVVSDNVRGMEELVRYVYSKGHRRIAFIHGERTAVTENRLTGFYRWGWRSRRNMSARASTTTPTAVQG